MLAKRLIKSNDAGGGACTNTVDLYNPFPDGGGVALYQLNGNANDVSGNYNGTATNVTYGAGQFGQAGVFNGSSSKIDISSISNSLLYSVSMWIKPSFSEAYGTYFMNGSAVSTEGSTAFNLRNNNTNNNFQIKIGANSPSYISEDFTENEWVHIVLTTNKIDTSKVYINGVDVHSFTSDFDFNVNERKLIGVTSSDRDGDYLFSAGSIDQVRIFSRALRPYEVEALYTEEYCTPTIVPSEHFNTVTWTGDNAVSRDITSVGFQPDFTWIKSRTLAASHGLYDSVRGAGYWLRSEFTDSEQFQRSTGYLNGFIADGFNLQKGSSTDPTYTGWYETNQSGEDYVSWNFKAGGAAVTNTDGTITSQVSANTEAGFSVVSYTGNETSGSTVGHGLSLAPQIIIVKELDVANNWQVYTSSTGATKFLYLNSTIEALTATNRWNDTTPTDTVFTIGNSLGVNRNSSSYIAYCFSEVEGFSNFGSYVGTGASGNTIVTGFEPAFVMVKSSSDAFYWYTFDNKRNISNPRNSGLFPNDSLAEITSSNYNIDFNSNGFTLQNGDTANNNSGSTYIYMAFAADPTTIEPTLEDSFNTVLYTGNGSTQSITGVGFQPDLLWIKERTNNSGHQLRDSVRGVNNFLSSDATIAEVSNTNVTSFDDNGFTVGVSNGTNQSGEDYVSWNWKGAELPAINSNGSIPSVVSANPAAGFSIVSHNGTGGVGTVGHGLDSAPKIIIRKDRDIVKDWFVYSSEAYPDFGYLNHTDAFSSNNNAAYSFNQSNATDSVFSVGNASSGNINNDRYIAYCFAEVAGFSKFGSHTGNGGTKSIDVGFEPAFVISKITSSVDNWRIYDNKRSPFGQLQDEVLLANGSQAEFVNDPQYIEFTSTGFNLFNNANNLSGETYIYMAFANQF